MKHHPIPWRVLLPRGGSLDGDRTTEIPLPAGPLALRVSLLDAVGAAYARWGFDPTVAPPGARLRIDLRTLNQGSMVLSGGGASPLARDYLAPLVPPHDAVLRLLVENLAAWPGAAALTLPVTLADPEATRARWLLALTLPAQWFYVEITTYCNLECPFCPSKDLLRPRQHMTPELAEIVFGKIAAYLARQDLREAYVQFRPMVFLHVMGEPVLHPRLTEIVALAHGAGLAVGIFTNVTLLNAKNIRRLLAAGPELVTLSVNVSEEEGYAEFGAKDSLADQHYRVEAYLAARAGARAFGTGVDLQYMTSLDRTVRGSGLLRSQRDAWRLFDHWQARVRDLYADVPTTGRSLAQVPSDHLADPLSLRGDPSHRIPLGHGINLAIKGGCSFGNTRLPKGLRVQPATRGHCPFNSPFQQMAVFVDGSVSFCNLDHENTVNLGNLRDQEIDEIWINARMARIRGEMAAGVLTEPVCQRCLGQIIPA